FGWRTRHERSANELLDWMQRRTRALDAYFTGNTICNTRWENTALNRILFYVGFGWIWMRFPTFELSWGTVWRALF
ncbi:MAG: hypothetical protein FWB76_05735, partial [Oscillospiraceae bacterium]|nr:hypothetical protein [Oscillospiraceae bacterium]